MLSFTERSKTDLTNMMLLFLQEDEDPEDTLFLQLTKHDAMILAAGMILIQAFLPTNAIMGRKAGEFAGKCADAAREQKGEN